MMSDKIDNVSHIDTFKQLFDCILPSRQHPHHYITEPHNRTTNSEQFASEVSSSNSLQTLKTELKSYLFLMSFLHFPNR